MLLLQIYSPPSVMHLRVHLRAVVSLSRIRLMHRIVSPGIITHPDPFLLPLHGISLEQRRKEFLGTPLFGTLILSLEINLTCG